MSRPCTMEAAAVLWLLSLTLSSSSSSSLPPVLDISLLESSETECARDLAAFRQGLASDQRWAQTMWDAGVKAPVGLLSQTAVQFGDFDECLTLSSPVTPQFCMVDLVPAPGNNSTWSGFKLGLCLPASCSPPVLQPSLQTLLDMEATAGKVRVAVSSDLCTTRDSASHTLTALDLVFCALITTIVLLVGAATAYDVLSRPHYDGVSPPETVSECLSARHGVYSLIRLEQRVPGLDLQALNGLHSCAFFFIILGHRFGVHILFMTLTNYRSVEHMFVDSWFSIWAGHMDLFVDLFFFMSSFLLGVLYYAELHKHSVSPIKIFLQRICRLIPAYASVILFYSTVLRQMGDGPLWNMFMDGERNNCRNVWWTNLLFINNYVKKSEICLPQSWYISCDFQLFVVGTLLVFLLHSRERLGVLAMVFVFLASSVAPFLGTYLYNRPPIMLFFKEFWTNPRNNDVFSSVYTQAHYRGTSYLVGLSAGCYVYKRRLQPLSKSWTHLLQGLGVVTTLVIYWSGSLWYDQSNPISPLLSALYAASYHTLFGLGLSLLIVSCSLGKPTFLSRLLSWRGFVTLSKLSYCVYLVHFVPMFVWLASSRTPVYLNPLELISWTIADSVICLVAALGIYLAVETPFKYLVKHFLLGSPARTRTPMGQTLKKDVI